MTSSDVFQKFTEFYEPLLPPLLRDVLSEPDRRAFLSQRFEAVRLRTEHRVVLGKDPVLWDGDYLEVVLPDLPFVVDVVQNLLESHQIRIRFRISALFSVERDDAGSLTGLQKSDSDVSGRQEAWLYFSLEHFDDSVREPFLRSLNRNLSDLEYMVEDFPQQLAAAAEVEGDDDFRRDREWLIEHFILMGTAELDRNHTIQKGLGILRNEELAARLNRWLQRKQLAVRSGLSIYETDIPSEVKTNKPLHVALLASETAVRLLIGSFASKGELSPRFTIPAMRRKIDAISASLDIPIGSHNWRELYRLTQMVPLGLLFTRSKEFWQACFGFLLERQNIDEGAHILLLDQEYGGCWLIRTVFDGEEIARNLRAFFRENDIRIRTEFRRHNEGVEYEFLWLDSDQGGESIRQLIDQKESRLLRSYRDRLLALIGDRFTGAQRIRERSLTALHALNEDVKQHLTPAQFLDGLLLLEKQTESYHVRYESGPAPAFHVFSKHPAILSEMTPAFDSLGLSIQHAIRLSFDTGNEVYYRHLFFVVDPLQEDEARRLCEVLSGILNQRTSVDLINRICRRSDFTLRRLRMLKALLACFYQMDRSFSGPFLMQMMLSHADLALAMIQYAEATFSHADPAERQKAQRMHSEAVDAQVSVLRTLSERLVGMRLRELLFAIVRTNFLLDEDEISLKIESRRLSFVSEPKPLYEIFVYATDFEGVHLRFGPVSRGGIRWSDRTDDFRVEILGLVHTQRIKNTMIVPEGSKGGFVLKRTGMNPVAGKAAYRRFMHALLRMTDNLINGQEVRPQGLVCLDGFDPYLVVAADRGTARFSDTANEVSAELGFWIGDAFASGGRFGYDHKKQGITARGAWESVKSHFATLGINPEVDVIRCVGIGDMSGDVFGNGMLLSSSIKLIAAFNHRHIFIDPDPDPLLSFEERKRLFEAGLDWDAYTSSLFSPGGGVYERDMADIQLSEQARQALGITKASVSGDELVRAILCADVDLLWNGGIGTYVKASYERNEEIGDPANDSVRVDGSSLRVRVVGEGGNLGFSMQGRYEAASAGVLLNTDAVDNSAGVDMSDHEVNLKILLEDMLVRGLIQSREERNELIRSLEPLMIDQVLSNNRSINRCIRMEQRRLEKERSALPLWIQELINYDICEQSDLPPQPDRLSSPFVGNLVGWSKLYYRSRINIDGTEEDFFAFVLRRFEDLPFDKEDVVRDALQRHPLRDAIARTEVINHIVHHAGPTFLFRIHHQLGLPYEDIISHRLRIERWINAGDLRKEAEAAGTDHVFNLENMMERAFFVLPFGAPLDVSLPQEVLHGTDYARLLNHIRLVRHGIHKRPDLAQQALHRLTELRFDELEQSIRLIAVSDLSELRFQGRLLLQLEKIRSVAVHESIDARRLRHLIKGMKEARRLLRDRPTAAIALYEHFRSILEVQQSFAGD